MTDANDNTGVCGFLWPTCSRLVPCNSSDNSCLQSNTICVHHPQCDDRSLWYPVTMINIKGILNGIAVAGGNGEGSELNQLAGPMGIFIDDEKTIYIIEAENKRIVAWKHDSKNGQVIVDGNGNDQLTWPTDVIFDKQNNSWITCDPGNARVMRWFYQNQIKEPILISGIGCGGLTIDKNGFIYISDWHNNEVRQWIEGDQYGRIVAGDNGYGNGLNQFNHPDSLFVDEDQSVYVLDRFNHREMK
ncbi:unnamed protein product [Adineta steineri]|uniref:Uncharacterized protein n=1 Tax=Adineta steineri TaxID=433720 RepID=A0A815PZX5_9BILA|nr:unnamed protein product [Adineta steineri]CAF1632068.1 unnamed protein product [Adineta steineri]